MATITKSKWTVSDILRKLSTMETVTVGAGGRISYRHGAIKGAFVRNPSSFGKKADQTSTVVIKMAVGPMIGDALGLAFPTDPAGREAYWAAVEKALSDGGLFVKDGGKVFATFSNNSSVAYSVDDLMGSDAE